MSDAPAPVFTIPRSFSPTHSVVGRLIRRRSGDRLRGEALYIFIVTMAVVAWLLAGFAAWAMLADVITADPAGPAGLTFFGIQVAVPIVGLLIAGVGFRPEIRIEIDGSRLVITRGSDQHEWPLDEPLSLRTIDAVTYHRGLRLLDTTRPFINRPAENVLAITLGDETVVLGLAPEDRKELESLLSRSHPTHDRIASSTSDVAESVPT